MSRNGANSSISFIWSFTPEAGSTPIPTSPVELMRAFSVGWEPLDIINTKAPVLLEVAARSNPGSPNILSIVSELVIVGVNNL